MRSMDDRNLNFFDKLADDAFSFVLLQNIILRTFSTTRQPRDA